jgi:hypothetical protein
MQMHKPDVGPPSEASAGRGADVAPLHRPPFLRKVALGPSHREAPLQGVVPTRRRRRSRCPNR